MSQALSVSLERKGTVIDVNYDTTALQNIHVDLNEVAEDDRSGKRQETSRRLSAVLLHRSPGQGP